MRLTWPLAGRGEEMRLIEAALSDADASGVVISGSAGVGKSRIGREALVGAASRGCDVRWVVGTSCGRGIPLGALVSWPGLVGDDSLQLVCGVIDSLTAASSAGRVLVGVDDPHLLDDLSMFVLDQVVQRVGRVSHHDAVDGGGDDPSFGIEPVDVSQGGILGHLVEGF